MKCNYCFAVAITWDNAPTNQYPILGEDFPIVCKVRARPSPSVDWLYNGELIKTNDHYIIDTYALTIKNVQESDDGIYTCRASVLYTGELKERPIRVEVRIQPCIHDNGIIRRLFLRSSWIRCIIYF